MFTDAVAHFLICKRETSGAQEKITVDAYVATHSAISELKGAAILPAKTVVRTSKYLNSLIEQDH